MKNYVSLHNHSDHSVQDGAQSTDKIAEKAAKLGMKAVALTDHGRAGGLLSFKKSCEKHKIRPIYGMEAYVAPFSRFDKKHEGYKPSSHMCLLAKNNKGLENLFKLTSLGWIEGQDPLRKYYTKPRIDLELLERYKEGLVVTTGCGSGFISQMLLHDNPRVEEAAAKLKELIRIFGEDVYLEVQNHGLSWQGSLKKALFEMSALYDVPIIATQDSHYTERTDAELHRHICRLATGGGIEFEGDESFFKSYDELAAMFNKDELHALDMTNEVADKCQAVWEFGKTIWPVYELPKEETPDERLRKDTETGFAKLFPNPTQEYRDRIEYELGVISEMGFPTYFLVVAEFIQWAKDNGIPSGPGRGSGAGSLVCYALGITDVDPIKYGLYFQRFLNSARISLPDLDIDFCPKGRKLVMQHVAEKYGAEKVAQIGTYSEFKPRGSLRDFTRTSRLDKSIGAQLAGMIPPNKAGKTLKFEEVIEKVPEILKTKYPEVVDLARNAEKMKNKAGVHAAGVIISDRDLSTQVPLFRGKHDEIASQFDMHDVEDIGLVKYDFLGLKNLSVIDETTKEVEAKYNVKIDWKEISEDDKDVFTHVFQYGRLDGIFQFENSSGFRDLCFKVKPVSIEDLSVITALFRPGPLGSGLVDKYAECRQGAEPEYLFPKLEPILKETYGIMVFQEQIMKICTDCAGYTLAEADNMRKIIGKKLPEKMKLEREKLVNGCIGNGIPKAESEELFDQIEDFAKYSFNKAHSVAYSIISYRTAWLKHYYPVEFYTAIMNNADAGKDQGIKYIYACREDEIAILPPDVNASQLEFTNDNGTVIFGLSGIKGIAKKGGDDLLKKREEAGGSFDSLEEIIKTKPKKTILVALAESGALEEITELSREQLVQNIETLIDYYKKLAHYHEKEEKIAERLHEIELWDINKEGPKPRKVPGTNKEREEPEFPDVTGTGGLTRKDRLRLEHKTLGFYLTGHPLDDYDNLSRMAKYTIGGLKEEEAKDKEKISVPVVISKITEITTRKGHLMANLIVEDKTGRQDVTVFQKTWKKMKGTIEEQMVCMLHGRLEKIIYEPETNDNDEYSTEEYRTIVNVIATAISKVEETEIGMDPIEVILNDGSKWIFEPNADMNPSRWQQAYAYVENIKRMG